MCLPVTCPPPPPNPPPPTPPHPLLLLLPPPQINASYGTNGQHTLSCCTTKGDLALLFILGASDKQWVPVLAPAGLPCCSGMHACPDQQRPAPL
jgi:hypothetical protein